MRALDQKLGGYTKECSQVELGRFHAGKSMGKVPWASAMCPGIPIGVLGEQECFESQPLAAAEEYSLHRLCSWRKQAGDMALVRGQILPQNPLGRSVGWADNSQKKPPHSLYPSM